MGSSGQPPTGRDREARAGTARDDRRRAGQPPAFTPRSGAGRPDDRDVHVVGKPPESTPRRPAPPPSIAPATAPSRAAPGSRAVRPVGTVRAPVTSPRAEATTPTGAPSAPPRPRRVIKRIALGLALLGVLLLAWPVGLGIWAQGRIAHTEALSGAPDTPGTTYLLVGSDSREGTTRYGQVPGKRSDTMMLLHVPQDGTPSLVSLPRDSYVGIPGHGKNKLNAAFAFAGAPLLVTSVEKLSGLTVDHYVEVGFGGVQGIVNALGGVDLCYDRNVKDPKSKLTWTAGCHHADGATALAFSRMRLQDPEGDIGRTRRQQQLIAAITKGAATRETLMSPTRQVDLIRAGLDAVVVDRESGIVDLGRLALAFRDASGPGGFHGTPPITSNSFHVSGVGSTVLLDAKALPAFWRSVANGTIAPQAIKGAPA